MKPIDKAIERPRTRPVLTAARFLAKLVLPAVMLAGAYFAYSNLVATKPEVARRPAQERVWPVTVTPATFNDYRPEIVAYGTLTAGREVLLRALVAGQVVAVGDAMKDGAQVAADEVLLEIDRFDYESAVAEARANLDEAAARRDETEARIALEEAVLATLRRQLEIAERDLERAAELVARGTVSERTVEERELTVSQRRQQIVQGESNVRIQEARLAQELAAIERLGVALARAERDLADTTLRAPFAGIVSDPSAEIGRMLGANDQVATIIADGEIEARFTLTDAQYGRLLEDADSLVGRPVSVVWQTGTTERAFPATIRRVAPEIVAARGGVDVFAVLEPGVQALRPGAFVEIRLADRQFDDVLRIPETALYGVDVIYVVVDGRLQQRQVEVVGQSGSNLLVRGDIEEGARILTSRITEVGAGLRVEVVDR